MMDTTLFFWLTITAVSIVWILLGTIIYSLYKQLSSAHLQIQQSHMQQQEYHLQAENYKIQAFQLQERNTELKNNHQQVCTKLEQLQLQCTQLSNQKTELATLLKQKEHHFEQQLQLLNDNKQQLKLEFEQLAAQIFDAKGKSFNEHSQQSLQSLLTPFREQITSFNQRIEEIHRHETIQKATFNQELQHLKELNKHITEETHNLTLALKGDKKMQGNWGELILENVLERAGLQVNKDYYLQKRIHSPEGDTQVPDVILQLPQQKHLIIDAKVSLNAYTRSINAETQTLQLTALNEHAKAVAERIKELSERFYYQSPDVKSPELVIMFIPIESAFVSALQTDETLFQKAIDKNILVATPTTLLASLTIVRQLWRLENQTRNTLELANTASKVYDKLRTFLNSMDRIEKGLVNAQEAYQEAKRQLLDGRGNLVNLVNGFVELGVTVKNEINVNWQEQAALGIEAQNKQPD